MTDLDLIRFLKKLLTNLTDEVADINSKLQDILNDKCRSCSRQDDCWRHMHYLLLTPVALEGGKQWECANYKPKSCAAVMGRPLTLRVGK